MTKKPKMIDLNLPKVLAYIALVLFAVVGIKTILDKVNHIVAYGFAVGICLLIVHIILKD